MTLVEILKLSKTMFLFFIFVSLVEPKRNSRGRDLDTTPIYSTLQYRSKTTWLSLSIDMAVIDDMAVIVDSLSTTKLPPSTTTSSRTSDKTQTSSTSHMTTKRPLTSKPWKISSSKESKTFRRSYTTYTYPRDPREDFNFISARNESELDEFIAIKCNQGGEMDLYFGELENKCILIIFCCGPNKNPEKVVHYIPMRNGSINQKVRALYSGFLVIQYNLYCTTSTRSRPVILVGIIFNLHVRNLKNLIENT